MFISGLQTIIYQQLQALHTIFVNNTPVYDIVYRLPPFHHRQAHQLCHQCAGEWAPIPVLLKSFIPW